MSKIMQSQTTFHSQTTYCSEAEEMKGLTEPLRRSQRIRISAYNLRSPKEMPVFTEQAFNKQNSNKYSKFNTPCQPSKELKVCSISNISTEPTNDLGEDQAANKASEEEEEAVDLRTPAKNQHLTQPVSKNPTCKRRKAKKVTKTAKHKSKSNKPAFLSKSENNKLPPSDNIEIRSQYYGTSTSVLPAVYPQHFTNQIPAMPYDEAFGTTKNSQAALDSVDYQLTPTNLTQSPSQSNSSINSLRSRTPSLPESLRGIFQSDDIRDILNIEKVKYRLSDTHLQAVAMVMNVDANYLRNLVEKILQINTCTLLKFNATFANERMPLEECSQDHLKFLDCFTRMNSPSYRSMAVRSPSVLERTPTPSPRKSMRFWRRQRESH